MAFISPILQRGVHFHDLEVEADGIFQAAHGTVEGPKLAQRSCLTGRVAELCLDPQRRLIGVLCGLVLPVCLVPPTNRVPGNGDIRGIVELRKRLMGFSRGGERRRVNKRRTCITSLSQGGDADAGSTSSASAASASPFSLSIQPSVKCAPARS